MPKNAKPPRRPGRPRKTGVDPKYTERITAAIRIGAYFDAAARYAGISPTTAYAWMHRFPHFREAVENAKGDAEVRALGVIAKASLTSWQAAAWMLERTRPAKFALRVNHLLEQELDAVLDDLERELTDGEFQKVTRILAGRAGRIAGEIALAEINDAKAGEAG